MDRVADRSFHHRLTTVAFVSDIGADPGRAFVDLYSSFVPSFSGLRRMPW